MCALLCMRHVCPPYTSHVCLPCMSHVCPALHAPRVPCCACATCALLCMHHVCPAVHAPRGVGRATWRSVELHDVLCLLTLPHACAQGRAPVRPSEPVLPRRPHTMTTTTTTTTTVATIKRRVDPWPSHPMQASARLEAAAACDESGCGKSTQLSGSALNRAASMPCSGSAIGGGTLSASYQQLREWSHGVSSVALGLLAQSWRRTAL
jgi:hypothetical protein